MKVKILSVVLILSLLIFNLFGCTGFYELKDSERPIFENNFPPNSQPIDVNVIIRTNNGETLWYLPNEARIVKKDSGRMIAVKSNVFPFSDLKDIRLNERIQIQTTDGKTYEFGNAGLSFCFTNGMLTHLQGKDVIIKIENVKKLSIEKLNVGNILTIAGVLIVIGIMVAIFASSQRTYTMWEGTGGF